MDDVMEALRDRFGGGEAALVDEELTAAVAVAVHRRTGAREVELDGAGPLRIDPSLTFRELTARVRELGAGLGVVAGAGAELDVDTDRLARLVERLAEDPDVPVGRVDLAYPEELERLRAWNDTGHPVPATTLVRLIEEQAARTPGAEAVRDEAGALDFARFGRESNRLARLLIARGAGRGRTVAVALPRSNRLPLALAAVLKSGAAYVPLDLDHPAGRLAAVGEDTRPVAVVGASGVEAVARTAALEGAAVLDLDAPSLHAELARLSGADLGAGELPDGPAGPEDPAYVIHTSGTTGRPKGVVIAHGAICNRLLWMREEYGTGAHDRVLHKTPAGFDVSVWELFLPLISGAAMVVAPPGAHRDPARLAELVRRERVTLAHFVPSMLQVCLQGPGPWRGTGLRRIVCSGEALPTELAARATEVMGAEVHNLYGPTEAAVDVTAWRYSAADTTPTVPIGRPVWNTRTHVLDAALRPVPPGTVGELYLAGDQLARGYLGRPELTAGRFVADPFGPPGGRMYRTGDLVRQLAGGELEFLGRADQQIKLRGVRIEPAGIEAALAAHTSVRTAAVLLREDRPGHPYLAAYVVPVAGADAGPEVWREHLARLLPDAMVPGAFVTLERLPTTVNGKLDRAALPAPTTAGTDAGEQPGTVRERALCALFARVLGLERVGPHDNFLALGGHSLTAARLSTLVRTILGVELSIRDLYEWPTPAALAERLDGAPAARPPLTARPRPARVPLSAAQSSLWFLDRMGGGGATYNMPLVLRPRRALDVDALRAALSDLADRHEILRTRLTAVDGTPYQEIAEVGGLRPVLAVVDCPEEEVEAQVAAVAHRRFDLEKDAPLWGAVLGGRVVVLVLHHVAGDGWSLRPLARELGHAYAARAAGRAPEWEPLPVQYADYALWQEALLGEGVLAERQRDFWRDTLDGLPERTELPVDRRPGDAPSPVPGGNLALPVDARLHAALKRLAEDSGASLFMVLHAALAALLTRWGAGSDIAIGTPVAARADSALDGLIGHFANTLVLRADTSGDPRFRELLDRVRAVDLAAYDHQDLPFESVVEAVNPVRVPGRHPLFQVMLALQNNEDAELRLGEEVLRLEPHPTATAKFDLFFDAVERYTGHGVPDGIDFRLDYSAELFDPGTAAALGEAWCALLAAVAANSGQRLGHLPAPRHTGEGQAVRPESRVLAQGGIRDAVSVAGTGSDVLVLAVPEREGAVRRAAETTGVRVVAVSDLPRTPDGDVDRAVLSALEPVDEVLADEWRRELGALPGVLAAEVTLEADAPERAALEFAAPTHAGAADEAVPVAADAPPSLSEGPPLPEPAPATLDDALLRATQAGPGGEVVHVRADGTEVRRGYASLYAEATRVLGGLRAHGLAPRDAVILQCDDNEDFLAALWGCLLGGFVVVPLTVPPSYDTASAARAKLVGVHSMLGRPWVITSGRHAEAVRAVLGVERESDESDEGDAGALPGAGAAAAVPRVATVGALRNADPDTAVHPARPEDTALMLLTSGSTGLPKAVRLSHRNILTRSAATAAVNSLTADETSLNWIPMDHVTGVVMFHLRDVYLGCRQVHAPTSWVLADPLRWLDLAHRHRATVTWAPNFAFGLLAEHAHRMADRTWDLSALRFITNAGEVVVAATARRFLELLAPYGLPRTAMHPGWGMSETSSVVTDAELAAEPSPDEGAVVSCGLPYPGFAMRVVDDEERIVPEGTPGRLQVRGTSVTEGYHDNPEQNAEAFTRWGWFETGDLAYLHDGELYLTGRAKDVIIINGVNHYSHEIEAVAEELPFVQRSFTAACAVRTDLSAATDSLALFVHLTPGTDEAAALRELRGKVTRETGVAPAHLVPVGPEDIPKTEIGKIQRTLLRRRFEAGEFDAVVRRAERLLGTVSTVPDWFLRPVWQRAELGALPGESGAALVVAGRDVEAAGRIAGQWRAVGGLCTVVTWADAFVRRDAAEYRLRADSVEDWTVLLERLAADGRTPDVVMQLGVHEPDGDQLDDSENLLVLAKALAARPRPVAVHLVTVNAWAVEERDRPSYAHAAAGGLLKSLRAELPWLEGRHLDFDELDVPLLMAETGSRDTAPEVAYRAGLRFVRRLAPVAGPLPPAPALPTGGFHVVSGGLGGLATEVCAHLLATPGTRLLLLGRTEPAPGDNEDARSVAYRRLSELGQVRYESVDVTDEERVRAAVERAARDWGVPLAGVFHLAGGFDQRPAVEYSPHEWRNALAAKVTGGRVLAGLAAAHPGAAFTAFSSVNGFFGGALSSAYSAANAFLDALAVHQRRVVGVAARSLAWSRWDELGMSRGYGLAALTEARGYRTVDLASGLRSLRAALGIDEPHLLIGADRDAVWVGSHVVAPSRPLHRLAARVTLAEDTDLGALHRAAAEAAVRIGAGKRWVLRAAGSAAPSPDSRTEGDSAVLALEEQLTGIWREVLGTDRIGPLDNFFELGGTSLLLVRVQTLAGQRLGHELTVVDLFDHPSVRALAAHLLARAGAPVPGGSSPTLRRARDRAARHRVARSARRPLDTEGTVRHV
ncbi:amino acid adenylation domain-containing protein [Streptomyces sp. NPDC048415]|uniref:amino acid adenylation domain-containing protein n=1 Tax=Streptomyces sp. NPDC048415 TaxID=3154822 RepID=UPI003434CF09